LSPYLEYEWRTFLRNDWESKKTLIPILIDPAGESKVPLFLRGRRAVATTNFDEAMDQVEHLLKRPSESLPPVQHTALRTGQRFGL
jgi:hypothetical protein